MTNISAINLVGLPPGWVVASLEAATGGQVYADVLQPGYMTISVLGWLNPNPTPYVGQRIVVYLGSGSTAIFDGFIQAVDIEPLGDGRYLNNYRVQQNVALEMAAVAGGSGYPSQSTYDRINAITADSGWHWSDLSYSMTWDSLQYDNTLTWSLTWDDLPIQNAAMMANGVTISPKSADAGFTLDAYVDGESTVYDLLTNLAQDVRGFFDGTTFYQRTDMATGWLTPQTIDASQIVELDLMANVDSADIVNQVKITNVAGTWVWDNQDSISQWGLRTLDYQSQIAAEADLLTVATEILSSAAQPRLSVTSITVVLNDTDWNTTNCPPQRFIQLTNMPYPYAYASDLYFVTGYRYNFDGDVTTMTLSIQNKDQILPNQSWDEVSTGYAWTSYLPNSDWANAA